MNKYDMMTIKNGPQDIARDQLARIRRDFLNMAEMKPIEILIHLLEILCIWTLGHQIGNTGCFEATNLLVQNSVIYRCFGE